MNVSSNTKVLVIEALDRPVLVHIEELVLARSENSLILREAGHAGVVYVPRGDADMTRLARSSHVSRCPLKGQATYYSIWTAQGSIANAAWSYDMPDAAAEMITGYIAFDPERVEITVGGAT